MMIKMNFLKKVAVASVLLVGLSASKTALAGGSSFSGEYRQGEILSFGSNLNKKEEAALREYFGVSSDMAAIYVDNATAIEQLGLAPNALDNYTGGWYSSAYVKLTNSGGVVVTSNNVSLVTNEMFTNALITSGILNCEVMVSAPFMVTGESALAGILAGAEEIMGESLSEENKVVAKEEIDTTLEIADELLNNEENEIHSSGDSSTVASGIINDIKQQVIKDSPNSTQIQQIIINVTKQYGVELSEETNARVLSLMEEVKDLNIDYQDIEETMKNIGDKISNSLKEAGIKLQESGFFERIFNRFTELFHNFVNWIKGIFVNSTEPDSAVNDVISPEINLEDEAKEEPEGIVTDDVIESSEIEDENTDATDILDSPVMNQPETESDETTNDTDATEDTTPQVEDENNTELSDETPIVEESEPITE